MNDNELVKREYIIAIDEFEKELKRIDKKWNTFAKIDFETKEAFLNDGSFPMIYHRNINLKEIVII